MPSLGASLPKRVGGFNPVVNHFLSHPEGFISDWAAKAEKPKGTDKAVPKAGCPDIKAAAGPPIIMPVAFLIVAVASDTLLSFPISGAATIILSANLLIVSKP